MPRPTTVLVKIRSFRSAARARGHACSCALEALRYLAPALREPGHDLLVQPDIHVGGAVELAPVAKFLCQLFAGTEAAVQLQELHQIDDRLVPIEVLILVIGDLLD